MSTLFLTDEETETHQHEIRPAPPRQIPQQQPSNFCNDNSKEESVKVLSAMFPVLSETVISDAFDFCKGDSNQVVKFLQDQQKTAASSFEDSSNEFPPFIATDRDSNLGSFPLHDASPRMGPYPSLTIFESSGTTPQEAVTFSSPSSLILPSREPRVVLPTQHATTSSLASSADLFTSSSPWTSSSEESCSLSLPRSFPDEDGEAPPPVDSTSSSVATSASIPLPTSLLTPRSAINTSYHQLALGKSPSDSVFLEARRTPSPQRTPPPLAESSPILVPQDTTPAKRSMLAEALKQNSPPRNSVEQQQSVPKNLTPRTVESALKRLSKDLKTTAPASSPPFSGLLPTEDEIMDKASQPKSRSIQIIDVVKSDTYHEYVIRVVYRTKAWHVQRRYKLFDEMHNQLKKSRNLPANWMDRFQIPRKKLRGNTSPTFVAERQLSLENYLRELYLDPLTFQQPELRDFLDFEKQDRKSVV